jgi:hypothetical protein
LVSDLNFCGGPLVGGEPQHLLGLELVKQARAAKRLDVIRAIEYPSQLAAWLEGAQQTG